jgi:hypothetical protein
MDQHNPFHKPPPKKWLGGSELEFNDPQQIKNKKSVAPSGKHVYSLFLKK